MQIMSLMRFKLFVTGQIIWKKGTEGRSQSWGRGDEDVFVPISVGSLSWDSDPCQFGIQ